MPALKGPNTSFWAIRKDGVKIGQVTSAVYSPRLDKNIALAIVAIEHVELGIELEVIMRSGSTQATIVERPFYDPKKNLAAKPGAASNVDKHALARQTGPLVDITVHAMIGEHVDQSLSAILTK